jgi:hypothetical protein
MPTDRRFTASMRHCGHSCRVLSSVISVEYRFLTTAPYLGPKIPEGPTLYVLPIAMSHWEEFSRADLSL